MEPVPARRESGAVDAESGRVYLHPGEFTVAVTPCTITTILGSCVAVCLYDPVACIGGLNHFLLPRAPAESTSLRFGDVAVPRLIEAMAECGAVQRRLQAKVIGGACVLHAYRDHPSHVGRQNVLAAVRALFEASIPVVMTDVEGNRGRRVVLHANTGDLVVRLL
jgi:chemotaxis protein CheD